MPLVTDRRDVLEIFARAQERGWVIPAFGTENLTTTEAILAGAQERALALDEPDLPIMIAATNRYPDRSQTSFYTHTRDCNLGLELLLADLQVLAGPSSPFGRLRILLHLDHIQHDLDESLWRGNLSRFSSIMFDASTLPLEENIAATRRFVAERREDIVIEGACDYIGGRESRLTDVAEAERFLEQTGVDWMVPNLGTEHRAGVSELRYARDLARQIAEKIGPRLVLHGTSSVSHDQLGGLAEDGVAKVNLWTALERDASAVLLREMTRSAGPVAGLKQARALREEGLLGLQADISSPASLAHFPTAARQQIIFEEMKKQVIGYLQIWYPQGV
jgi:fructose/tagatose bisphosphate aldolase